MIRKRKWRTIRWRFLWRRGKLLLLAGCLACTAAGCNPLQGGSKGKSGAGDPPPPSGEARETAQPLPAGGGEAPEALSKPEPTAPLTGQALQTPAAGAGRPVMVMVNNAPQARPQSGLTQADMLLEVLAEGEITRIVAVYQSSASVQDPIGPVRSIRPYFIELGKSFGAVQVHAGGSPDGYEKLKREGIDDLDEITNAGPAFWRESFRKAPHNLYTNLGNIREAASKKGYAAVSAQPVAYPFTGSGAEAVETAGTAAAEVTQVDVTFLLKSYKVTYAYDAGSRRYLRLINGTKHIDLNNNEQLSASNVIVMGADHKILDNEGRREVKLTGQGSALVFQGGRVLQAQWKRGASGEPIRFWAGGREVPLQPGQTHVMIVPNDPSFEGHVVYGAS